MDWLSAVSSLTAEDVRAGCITKVGAGGATAGVVRTGCCERALAGGDTAEDVRAACRGWLAGSRGKWLLLSELFDC